MKAWLIGLAWSAAVVLAAADAPATLIVVVGAPGEAEYGDSFSAQADEWTKTSAQAGARLVMIGRDAVDATTDHDKVRDALAAEPKEGAAELWLVLVGHGTFDGQEAKFNLRGPDLSTAELADWLKPFRRPLAIIDTSSSSAPFLAKLAGPHRAIITSTRSGYEQNYARFGKYFAGAVADMASDLDKDGQVSLMEAFLSAAHRTNEFYQTEGRLATEHAMLDDNGDGLGTPSDWFRGMHATKQASDGASLDGPRASQFHLVRSTEERELAPEVRARRDELELAVARLREEKANLAVDEYYRRLELVLLELARIYEAKPD